MIKPYSKIAIGNSNSKLILVGEHAVVYGKPAIAMPFPLKATSTIEESSGAIKFESTLYTGPIYNMPMELKGILDCIRETLHYLNQPFKGLHIRIDSFIPIGHGLGSSAAIAIAIVRSLFSFYEQVLSQNELFSLVQTAETHAHGNPSGVDMVTESSECPIWFKKGKNIVPIKASVPLYIVVGDTGRAGDTRRAVENIRKKYLLNQEKVQKLLDKIEKISEETKYALMKGNVKFLGKLLNHNQKELINLGVSNDSLNGLIETALNTGALGAKLTGGGLGGCMIALANTLDHAKKIAEVLVKSGAPRSWYFSTDEDIIYVSQSKRRAINESCSKGKY